MKAYEIQIRISKDGKVTIPEPAIKALPKETDLRAIILAPEASDKIYSSSVNNIKVQEFSYFIPPTEGIYDEY